MIQYDRTTGQMIHPADLRAGGQSQVIGLCYAGRGEAKNNPAMDGVADVGPLPAGFYTIEAPVNTPNMNEKRDLGPFAMRLIPDPDNDMRGRAGFWIHGDSIEDPGNASEGCIVSLGGLRERQGIWIAAQPDRRLHVI